jgi:hypothetical protein
MLQAGGLGLGALGQILHVGRQPGAGLGDVQRLVAHRAHQAGKILVHGFELRPGLRQRIAARHHHAVREVAARIVARHLAEHRHGSEQLACEHRQQPGRQRPGQRRRHGARGRSGQRGPGRPGKRHRQCDQEHQRQKRQPRPERRTAEQPRGRRKQALQGAHGVSRKF